MLDSSTFLPRPLLLFVQKDVWFHFSFGKKMLDSSTVLPRSRCLRWKNYVYFSFLFEQKMFHSSTSSSSSSFSSSSSENRCVCIIVFLHFGLNFFSPTRRCWVLFLLPLVSGCRGNEGGWGWGGVEGVTILRHFVQAFFLFSPGR